MNGVIGTFIPSLRLRPSAKPCIARGSAVILVATNRRASHASPSRLSTEYHTTAAHIVSNVSICASQLNRFVSEAVLLALPHVSHGHADQTPDDILFSRNGSKLSLGTPRAQDPTRPESASNRNRATHANLLLPPQSITTEHMMMMWASSFFRLTPRPHSA